VRRKVTIGAAAIRQVSKHIQLEGARVGAAAKKLEEFGITRRRIKEHLISPVKDRTLDAMEVAWLVF